MAINFLNKVDFNQNELDKARIVNEPNDTAAGTPVDGQLYYNTTDDVIKVGEGGAWVSISGDITEVRESTVNNRLGIDVVNPTGPIPIVGLDIVGLTALGAPALTDTLAVYDVSTTTNKKLTVADIIGTSTWKLEGDGANPQTIVNGDIVDFVGSTYISSVASAVSANNFAVTLTHDSTTRTDTTSTLSGVVFPVVDSISTNSTGHVTGVNIKTVTVPDVTTYDLTTAPTGTAVRLTGNLTGVDDVTISGTAGRIAMSRISSTELRVNFPDDVIIINDTTIGNDLTVNGVIIQTEASAGSPPAPLNTFAGQVQVPTATAGGNAPNLAQVEQLIAGVGVFQGGYSAATDPGTPKISGGSNVALDQGDYFVVTADGDITFSDTTVTVEVGDFIFANAGITAGSTPASTQYTIVIADANLATAGTLTGAKRGVAGFDATTFDVTVGAGNNPGFVTIKPLANPYGANVSLTSGVTSGGQTTFTVDIETLFTQTGSTAIAENCKAEVIRVADLMTVYPEVTRNGSGEMLFKFIPAVGNNLFKALITIV
jgi:hypothetical protein